MLAFVENGVAMAFDRASAEWTFDLDRWGVCGQGPTEQAALPSTGLGYREPLPDLLDELEASGEHVRATLAAMPADAARPGWTAVKLLRRLAWHERGELEVMRSIARGTLWK